jgi:hypothetical protein
MMSLHGVKGHCYKGPMVKKRQRRKWTEDCVVHGAPDGRMFKKRHQARQKCYNGIRKRNLKQQLCLGSKEASYEALRQVIGLEIMKCTIRTSALRHHGGASVTLRPSAHSPRKRLRLMVLHLNWLTPYQGAAQDEQP